MKLEEWPNVKATYREVSIEDWIKDQIENGDRWFLSEDNDNKLFLEFIDSLCEYDDDSILEENKKELKAHKDEVISILKNIKEKISKDSYKECVNTYVDLIEDFDESEYDVFCPDKKLSEKAKKEAITKLYNKYCM